MHQRTRKGLATAATRCASWRPTKLALVYRLAVAMLLMASGASEIGLCEPNTAAQGQNKAPTVERPMRIRFQVQIDADRTRRVLLMRALKERLKRADFVQEAALPAEDFFATELRGIVPSSRLGEIARLQYVGYILAWPADVDLPDGDEMMMVELFLNDAGPAQKQRDLYHAVRAQLTDLGSVESPGADHRQYRRWLGWVPAKALARPFAVARDAPGKSGADGASDRLAGERTAIKLARVVPEGGAVPAPAPAVQDEPTRIAPDLSRVLAGLVQVPQKEPLEIEIVLTQERAPYEIGWHVGLTSRVPSLTVLGWLGRLVFARIVPEDVKLLASQPEVASVRLPQPPLLLPDPHSPDALGARLLGTGLRGTATPLRPGVMAPVDRLVLVGTEFAGVTAHIGKELPAKTQVVDATVELHPDVRPLPEEDQGQGRQLALLVQGVWQPRELLLVRVPRFGLWQLEQVGRATQGKLWGTPASRLLEEQLRRQQQRLQQGNFELRLERKFVLDMFRDDDLGRKRLQEYFKKQKEHDAQQVAFGQRQGRLLDFYRQLQALRGTTTVVIGSYWPFSHPLLSEPYGRIGYYPLELVRQGTWFQLLPLDERQVWRGIVADIDEDAVLEWGRATGRRPDINFLAWLSYDAAGKTVRADLAGNVVIQVTLQWRQAKLAPKTDAADVPTMPLALRVLRQRDPAASALPADAFELAALSAEPPVVLEDEPLFVTYERVVRFTVPQAGGRFALQLLRKPSEPPRKAGWQPKVPVVVRVDVVDPQGRRTGRPLLADFWGEQHPSTGAGQVVAEDP